MLRIALILEITGFCLASVSVALLRIEALKNWADKSKGVIIETSQLIEQYSSSGIFEPIETKVEGLKKATGVVMLEPLRWVKDIFKMLKVLIYMILLVLINVRRIRQLWRNRQEIWRLFRKVFTSLSKTTESRFKLFGTGFSLLRGLLLTVLLQSIWITMEFMARKMAGKEAITKFVVVIGTLIVLVGLVLELVANL